jgi:hypothetical protein
MRSLRLPTTEENQAAWRGLLKVLAHTGSRPLMKHVFPFEQLTQAFNAWPGARWASSREGQAPRLKAHSAGTVSVQRNACRLGGSYRPLPT